MILEDFLDLFRLDVIILDIIILFIYIQSISLLHLESKSKNIIKYAHKKR